MQLFAVVDSPDHVCARYRVRAFAPALKAAGWDLTVEALEVSTLGRLAQIDRARTTDTVLVQRKLLPRWQVRRLRSRSRRLVFDLDDAVFLRDSYHPRGLISAKRSRRFRAIVRAADLVLAGNAFLADAAVKAGAKPACVEVLPTCVQTEVYPTIVRPEEPGRLDLAWIGSSSTLQGLERNRAIWERVGRELPGVSLKLICDRFPTLDAIPVEPIRWAEADEPGHLGRSGAGISWIPDDDWSRGKCGLKLLQYGAAGLPAVANPVGVHPEILRDGRTGFLAASPDAWVDAIRALRDDPAARDAMGREARRVVETDYSVAAWGSRFVRAIGGTAEPDRRRDVSRLATSPTAMGR